MENVPVFTLRKTEELEMISRLSILHEDGEERKFSSATDNVRGTEGNCVEKTMRMRQTDLRFSGRFF